MNPAEYTIVVDLLAEGLRKICPHWGTGEVYAVPGYERNQLGGFRYCADLLAKALYELNAEFNINGFLADVARTAYEPIEDMQVEDEPQGE